MFMLLKSQTSAIKYVFSFIPNQSNSEVGSPILFTIVFLPLINGKSVASSSSSFLFFVSSAFRRGTPGVPVDFFMLKLEVKIS